MDYDIIANLQKIIDGLRLDNYSLERRIFKIQTISGIIIFSLSIALAIKYFYV